MALTALDFPASPTNGQLYPDPPVTGQPQYAWNGSQWISSKAAVTQIARMDALGWSGMQINGSMEVSQELGFVPVSVSGTVKYVVDGFVLNSTGTQVVVGQQAAACPPGYSNSIQVTVTTAKASPAAGEFVLLTQRIEGYRMSRLAWGTASAKSVTIGFWFYASRTGTFSGALVNGAGNRSCPFSFTVNATSTWEYKTVTLAGDTTGTWAKDNTVGLNVHFSMMVGSTYQGTAGVWGSTLYLGVTGTTNCVAATSDFMLVTGVVVLPGIEAPTAAQSPLIMRPFDQELVTCKRYYERYDTAVLGWFGTTQAGSNYSVLAPFQVQKRATPTLSFVASAGGGGPFGSGPPNSSSATLNSIYITVGAVTSQFGFYQTGYIADTRL